MYIDLGEYATNEELEKHIENILGYEYKHGYMKPYYNETFQEWKGKLIFEGFFKYNNMKNKILQFYARVTALEPHAQKAALKTAFEICQTAHDYAVVIGASRMILGYWPENPWLFPGLNKALVKQIPENFWHGRTLAKDLARFQTYQQSYTGTLFDTTAKRKELGLKPEKLTLDPTTFPPEKLTTLRANASSTKDKGHYTGVRRVSHRKFTCRRFGEV
jgi:hypothetical protein